MNDVAEWYKKKYYNNKVEQQYTDWNMYDEIYHAIYQQMVYNAIGIWDTTPYWGGTPPSFLARNTLQCTDGTIVSIYLIEDYAIKPDAYDAYIWVTIGDKFIEYPLYCNFTPNDDWIEKLRSDESEERGLRIFKKIVAGGKKKISTLIKKNGIMWRSALVLTEQRLNNIVKLPCSCALSANGQVFHGVKELEEYCKEQQDNSSPYILKRCHRLLNNDEDNDYDRQYTNTDNDDDEYPYCDEKNILFCRNYLICKSKKEAQGYMQDFIGIGHISAMEPNKILVPDNFPPLVCYVDRCRHMVLAYKKD